ncbi:MAG: RidA family protein [Paracoccaceae bacterium]
MKRGATGLGAALLLSGFGATFASGQEIIRHAIPGSSFPISRAVEIPGNATVIYLSGAVPSALNAAADASAPDAFGNTEAQTVSVLKSIEATLSNLNLQMGDVFRMQVFLVAPDGADAMDFAGFMAGYTQFFGTETQPHLPVRSVFEVAGLANPAWLVEIEVTAVRPVAP